MLQKLLNYLLVASALCYITTLTACKKPETEYTYVSEQQKAYFDWNVGSYWVFYDSVAGRVDSLSVTRYIVNPPDAAANVGHQNIIIIINGFYPGHGTDTTEWNFILYSPDGTGLTISKGRNSANLNVLTNDFPFYIGENPTNQPDIQKNTTTFYQTLSIGGQVYYDVYKVSYTYSKNKNYETFYINKDCGFIAVFLNDEFFRKRLYLLKSHLVTL